MTIRLRLLLAFSLCLLLACCLISTIVFFYVRDVDERNFRELAISHLEGVEERINAFLEPGWMSVRYLASLPEVKTSRGHLSSYLGTTATTTLLYKTLTAHEKRLYDEFLRIHKSNRNFGLVFVANDDGQFAQAPEGHVKYAGYDPRKRPWYQEVLSSTQEIVVSSPYQTTGGGMVCSIMTRTTDSNGRPLGVVGIDYSLRSLTADLATRRIMRTGYLVILDRHGQILVDGHHPDNISRLADTYSELWRRAAGSPDGEFTGTNSRGVQKYVVTKTIPELNWKMAVVYDRAELLEASGALLRIMLWSTLGVFVVTLSIAFALARSITRPMEELVDASAIISDGRYETSSEMRDALQNKLAVRGSPETVRLSNALRSVIGTLQDRIDAAEAANRAKGEFLANMSHELFTPLNAVIGLNHALRNSCLDTVQKNYAEKIATSAKTLLTLINDLLDFSKAEAGKARLYETLFSLRETLESASRPFAEQASGKGLDYVVHIDGSLHDRLIGDGRKLERILVNVLSNAVKFTASGSVVLDVRLENSGDRHVLIHFQVTDTGIGIEDPVMKNLFSPFVQADSSTTRRFGGTGLGLALGLKYVTLMGGRLWAESEPGKGSTFHFVLPFAFPSPSADERPGNQADFRFPASEPRPDDAPRPPFPAPSGATADLAGDRPENRSSAPRQNQAGDIPAQTRDSPPVPGVPHEGKRVLVVEDNPLNQLVTVNLLEQIHLEPSVANNGVEALQMLSEQTFDLVLMDIQMPEMDGLTATRCIREDRKYAALPIIALTAHGSSEDRIKSLAAGMNDHMTKPVEAELFFACIRRWLEPEA